MLEVLKVVYSLLCSFTVTYLNVNFKSECVLTEYTSQFRNIILTRYSE